MVPASLFAKIDRPALQPLPAERYDLSQWSQARVNIDYHVAYDGNWYSVPYSLTGEQVEVRSTPTTSRSFIAASALPRTCAAGAKQARHQNEHRPKSHQAHLEWPPSRMVDWAAKVGANNRAASAAYAGRQAASEMATGPVWNHPAGAEYSPARMEAPPSVPVLTGAISYKSVKSFSETGSIRNPHQCRRHPGRRPSTRTCADRSISSKGETRCFITDTGKLEAMRLHGMAQAWRELAKSEQAGDLSFEDAWPCL